MNEMKRIIVEYGARRQQFLLTDRLISRSKFLHLIGHRFDIQLGNNSPYSLQIYDDISEKYHAFDDSKQMFDVMRDFQQLQRFRIMSKSLQSQKRLLLDNLQSTVGKLSNATRYTDNIQNLVGTLNHNCDKLNQLMDTRHSNSSSTLSYLFDPSIIQKDIDIPKVPLDSDYEDENFESVSCFDHPPAPIATKLSLTKPSLFTTDNTQTRIIPCKYAVRGTCHLGDKCSYLHDETCIQSAREWERRL